MRDAQLRILRYRNTRYAHLHDVSNIDNKSNITCILYERKNSNIPSIIDDIGFAKLKTRIQNRGINFATVSAKERRVMSRA